MKNKAFVGYSREWITFYKIPLLLFSLLLILVGAYIYFVLSAKPQTVLASHFTEAKIRVSNQSPSTGGGWQDRGNHYVTSTSGQPQPPASYRNTRHIYQSSDTDDYGEHQWDIWESREYSYKFEYRSFSWCTDSFGNSYKCNISTHTLSTTFSCGKPLSDCNGLAGQVAGDAAGKVPPGNNEFAGVVSGSIRAVGDNTPAVTATPPVDYLPLSTEATYRNMTPYLIVGFDSSYIFHGRASSKGFHNPTLHIDLWIKSNNSNQVTLSADDFCGSTSLDTSNDPSQEKMEIYIRGSGEAAGQRTLDSDTWVNAPSCNSRKTFNLTPIDKELDSKYLIDYNTRSSIPQEYKKYVVVAQLNKTRQTNAEAAIKSAKNAGRGYNTVSHYSYYNQFKLTVEQPSNSGPTVNSLLSFPETNDSQDANSANPNDNVLGISSRINSVSRGGNLDQLVILWEITFDVAGPAEDGCSQQIKRLIGLYDHDYDTGQARQWQQSNSLSPRIDIWHTARNQYLDAMVDPSKTQPVWESWRTIELGKDASVARNAWDHVELSFDNAKIYRLRFYNLNSQSWVQARVPFAQINTLEKCVDKPLFKVRYADISAGGRFGLGENIDACESQSLSGVQASIYGHANSQRGSSADYAARAHDDIHGFYSYYPETRSSPPKPAKQLTFANSDTALPWGGNLKIPRCLPNFWRESDKLQANPGKTLDLSTIGDNQLLLYKPNLGTLTLTGSTFSNLKTTIYVDGDLHITSNVVNNTGTWSAFNQIGYIVLIVKGNIYIDPAVGQLDAIVIAYSDDRDKLTDANTGHIYTCYTANMKSSASNVNTAQNYHNACKQNRLVMYGALIGQVIHLGRTLDETNVGDGVTEEILLAPEYFVGTPQLPTFANWIYHSDSVTVLPPNF